MIKIGKTNDLTDQRFGRLTVIKRSGSNKYKKALWICKCDCNGNEKEYVGSQLLSGRVKSCGCIQKETVANNSHKRTKYNTYDLTGEYGIGYTFKGEEFYFDLEDYEKIKNYRWYKDHKGYIVAVIPKDNDNEKRKSIKMHRLVMNVTDKKLLVDHIFHIHHDNRKNKLRIVTNSQNLMNSKLRVNNTSGVTGVIWDKSSETWDVTVNGHYIGTYRDFEDAVKSRKSAEDKYQGEFSYDNSMNYELNKL